AAGLCEAAALCVAAAAGLTSMVAAFIRYSIVTFSPTLRSPVTLVMASRPISQRSLPFSTTIMSSLSSSTGPVTWYVLGAAASAPRPAGASIARQRIDPGRRELGGNPHRTVAREPVPRLARARGIGVAKNCGTERQAGAAQRAIDLAKVGRDLRGHGPRRRR